MGLFISSMWPARWRYQHMFAVPRVK